MKVILFDLDGVLALPEENFSVLYARSHGYDLQPFTTFFETVWEDFVTGKRDLKEHIAAHPDFWKWQHSPEALLDFWFKAENIRNEALLEVIRKIRSKGMRCYIATEQEKYRTAYIRDVMFKNEFDGIFSTAEIGYKKNAPEFYQAVIAHLDVQPEDIIFFDDSQSKIDVALKAGLDARLYTGIEEVQSVFKIK